MIFLWDGESRSTGGASGDLSSESDVVCCANLWFCLMSVFENGFSDNISQNQ